MSARVKIIANYLPQYHRTKENDFWWGDGFTDWMGVKAAKPVTPGQLQPRVPLNENYYDLSDADAIRWQAKLAKKAGIYGWGIYHYWFNSDLQVLQKPAELLLNSKDIDIHFLFIWDNSSWKRSWSAIHYANDWSPLYDERMLKEKAQAGAGWQRDSDEKSQPEAGDSKQTVSANTDTGVLAELIYGDETDWKKHFDYLLPFFEDNRYIRINGKPAFVFFNIDNGYDTIKKMGAYWDQLACEAGLPGVTLIAGESWTHRHLDYNFLYEPTRPHNFHEKVADYVHKRWIRMRAARAERAVNSGRPAGAGADGAETGAAGEKGIRTGVTSAALERSESMVTLRSYNRKWRQILRFASHCRNPHLLYSGFADYDDTPRRGNRATIFQGYTPEKFMKYLTALLKISSAQDKEFIFLTAWNEWGEGAYLEPDEHCGYAALKAVRSALHAAGMLEEDGGADDRS